MKLNFGGGVAFERSSIGSSELRPMLRRGQNQSLVARSDRMNRRVSTPKFVVLQLCALLLFVATVFAQETTAGLQGTVRDTSGAVVKGAQIVITGTSLAGDKTAKTDGSGYYRFANLPPGTYTATVTAPGFASAKNQGLILEVGRLPSIDFSLQVGKTETIVEVSGEAPLVDVTSNTNQTNITE